MDARPVEVDEPEEGEAERPLVCTACGLDVSDRDAAVSVGGRPPVQAHLNPHGIAFEVFAVRRAWNLVPVGPSETAWSWFAGYAWTVVGCAGCGAHLGWRYDTVGAAEPRRFWGLIVGRVG